MNMAKTSGQKTENSAVSGNSEAPVSSLPETSVGFGDIAPPMNSAQPELGVVVPAMNVDQPPAVDPAVSVVEQSQVPDALPEVAPALQQELQAPQPAEQQRVGFKRKTATQTIPAALSKSATLKDVEDLLTEDLTDIYQSMTPQEQIAFRKKGEEVAHSIETLVLTFRATTRKVLDLIRGWLAMIPRVNRYFLEQESKIKTDEIMKLQKKVKEDAKKRVDLV